MYQAENYVELIEFIEECEQNGAKTFVDWTKLIIIILGVEEPKPSADEVGVPIGAYEKDGEIFIVKPTRDGQRLYALKLVEAPSERVTEAGEHVHFDFEYAKGAIFKLTEADKMPIERARQLMIRYGRCIVCGRRLKKAESVERGIGPVCIKYFRGD